jgi:hypothetical protein
MLRNAKSPFKFKLNELKWWWTKCLTFLLPGILMKSTLHWIRKYQWFGWFQNWFSIIEGIRGFPNDSICFPRLLGTCVLLTFSQNTWIWLAWFVLTGGLLLFFRATVFSFSLVGFGVGGWVQGVCMSQTENTVKRNCEIPEIGGGFVPI